MNREDRKYLAKIVENATDINRMMEKRSLTVLDQIEISGHHYSCTLASALMMRLEDAIEEGSDLNKALEEVSSFLHTEYHGGYERTMKRIMFCLDKMGYVTEAHTETEGGQFVKSPKFMESVRKAQQAGSACGHSACRQHWIDTGENRCVLEDEEE